MITSALQVLRSYPLAGLEFSNVRSADICQVLCECSELVTNVADSPTDTQLVVQLFICGVAGMADFGGWEQVYRIWIF